MKLKTLTKDELTDKICIVIGTRPSIVKQSPIIRELTRQELPYMVIHTKQHYSFELDSAFFRDLELPKPNFQLEGIRDCKLHGEQTAEMLRQIEGILVNQKPKIVLVGGDANSNLSGALAARKLNINVAHEEAGLRSFKWNVPEEHNRVIIDHISNYLFAPHENAKKQLIKEGVRGKISVTGSTITDAIEGNLNIAQQTSSILRDLALEVNKYIVLTLHHEETVDYEEELRKVVEGVNRIGRASALPIVFPAHPRTIQRLTYFGLNEKILDDCDFRVIKPLGYLDFLNLIAHCAIAVTDSGGLIQEAAILKIPCLTLGHYTEWKECVEIGANRVSANNPKLMEEYALELLTVDRNWPNPFGPPGAAKKIVNHLKESLSVSLLI